MRRPRKQCEACRLEAGARFRTLLNLFLCATCYGTWTRTGKVPEPAMEIEPEVEERRW